MAVDGEAVVRLRLRHGAPQQTVSRPRCREITLSLAVAATLRGMTLLGT